MNFLHQPIGRTGCVLFVAAAIVASLVFVSFGNDCYLADLPQSAFSVTRRDRAAMGDISLLDALQPPVEAYEACDDQPPASSGHRRSPGTDSAPCQSGSLVEQLLLLMLR